MTDCSSTLTMTGQCLKKWWKICVRIPPSPILFFQFQSSISWTCMHIRVISQLNWTFRHELVPNNCPFAVLHTKVSMFGVCLESVWRFEWRTFYIGSLGVKLILYAKWHEFGPQRTNIQCSLFKPPHWFQPCTKNSPNMENFVCKTTMFWSKLWLN